MMWNRTGGGCRTSAGGADLMEYPCDDSWENPGTGERVTTYSTFQRHTILPVVVSSMEEVYRLDGVKEL